jgi:hypothetical protein
MSRQCAPAGAFLGDEDVSRGLSLREGSPEFILKVKSSVFKAESLSKCHFDAFPARGKLPTKSVFHSKMDSLLYVEVVGVT